MNRRIIITCLLPKNTVNAAHVLASELKLNSCNLVEYENKLVAMHFICDICTFTVILFFLGGY